MADAPTIQRITGRTIVFSKSGNSPEHDGLLLPNGKKISETGTEELRSILAALGVENAFIDGRAILCSRYADLIGDVYHKAGMAAVKSYLEDKKKC
jgi:hypothetical protein